MAGCAVDVTSSAAHCVEIAQGVAKVHLIEQIEKLGAHFDVLRLAQNKDYAIKSLGLADPFNGVNSGHPEVGPKRPFSELDALRTLLPPA